MIKEIKIVPSLASADQLRLGEQIKDLGEYPFLHIDIEDGNFIPNITFGMKTVKETARRARKELDVHLLVTNPMDYIDDLLELGIKKIAFHLEAVQYPAVCLHRIHEGGGKAGVAFNFRAQVKDVLPYIDEVDYVLIMTSEPDGRDQIFRSCMLDKVREARRLLPSSVSVWVDGGISERNMLETVQSGADTLVMGRAVWGYREPEKRIAQLKRELKVQENYEG